MAKTAISVHRCDPYSVKRDVGAKGTKWVEIEFGDVELTFFENAFPMLAGICEAIGREFAKP